MTTRRFRSCSELDMHCNSSRQLSVNRAKEGSMFQFLAANRIASLSLYLLIAVASIALVCDRPFSHAAPAPTRLTIAFPSPSPRVAPLWLAQDLDFFGKYGLRPQIVLVRNNQMLIAGLAAGDIDIGYTGGTTVLGAAAAGAELRMVTGFVSRGRGFLTVRPDIRKSADLAGKRF
ncbi:MAG: ABC transporter substrate-binding protein, partial [Deltaproteobacteria bacterium]|nr:ABC transporter substrate-binding protein [Deltaproteobacteria bacterium]